jgi:hypothetical protein
VGVKKNLHRLAGQWAEAVGRSVDDLATRARDFIDRELDTVEELIASGEDQRPAVAAGLAALQALGARLDGDRARRPGAPGMAEDGRGEPRPTCLPADHGRHWQEQGAADTGGGPAHADREPPRFLAGNGAVEIEDSWRLTGRSWRGFSPSRSVAAASQGSFFLLLFGLGLSIPIILFCSALVATAMTRWPWLALVGAAVLGWVSGEMLVADP